MKYGRYGINAEAKASPEAPRKESATGNTQQPIGSSEKNAENTDTPLATALRETFIILTSAEQFLSLVFSPSCLLR